MSEQNFQIGAEGIDVEAVVRELRASVQQKIDQGVYDDARIARAERTNLTHLRHSDDFVGFYLRCLRDAVFVDISDFEIRERRKILGPMLVALKKVIWNLLKFYTYRLWSQQNQVNGLLVTALEGMDEKYADRIHKLEQRVAELEQQAGE